MPEDIKLEVFWYERRPGARRPSVDRKTPRALPPPGAVAHQPITRATSEDGDAVAANGRNPHVIFHNYRRGYAVCEVSRRE
jgi:hypothetical protein